MDRSLTFLERSVRDRQRELLQEAERLAMVRQARIERVGVPNRRSVEERVLLTTAARPGAAVVLQPRSPLERMSECAEKVAAWRLAAARFGRSLISVGRRLEQVGRPV